MEASLRQELTDPVSLELLVDPITVPCCGKSFSRQTLQSLLPNRKVCPNCRASLDDFDANNAPKNVLLASLVESLVGVATQTNNNEQSSHIWSCSLTPIKEFETMSELVLSCDKTDFKTRPSLFIAVVDESGSMDGRPMEQVRMALNHMVELAKVNTHVILKMISYSSGAQEIAHASEYGTRVGGTNFRAAFAALTSLLRSYKSSDDPAQAHQSHNVSSVAVAFLTDGMDGPFGGRDRLVPELKESMEHAFLVNAPPVVVHTVGFGGDCDRELLESIRKAGSREGFFRYADPHEDADALCNKLTDLFEFSSKASTVPVQIQSEVLQLESKDIRFAVDARRHGQYKMWIDTPLEVLEAPRPDFLNIAVNSALDDNVSVPILVKPPSASVFQRWLAKCTDDTAKTIFDTISGNANATMTGQLSELFCATLELRVQGILRHSSDDGLSGRAAFLLEQINALRAGTKLQLSKLGDLRFTSNFSNGKGITADKSKRATVNIRTLPPAPTPALVDKPSFEHPLHRRYTRNNAGMGRNRLQEAIVDASSDAKSSSLRAMIQESSLEDFVHTDNDGNNALMLAAYCGHSSVVQDILSFHAEKLDFEEENFDGETAVTLSIKKGGFHRTLVALMHAGAKIPRVKAFERFCIDHGYPLTAQVLSRAEETSLDIDETMTPEYIRFMYERAKESPEDLWDKNMYLAVALSKQMKDIAQELLANGTKPTIEMLVDCVPKTADHPEEAKYLDLAKLLLNHCPELIGEKTQPEGETALFAAASRGSLSHVEYFYSRGSDIEAQNSKGNTPLWISSFKRYPCIMEFLLVKGANIHHCNLKGNPVLYGPCCRGPPKVAEQLIQSGAAVDKVFETGETPILMCCRNGTSTVLNLLLSYVDEDFVNHKAPVDGFNALMASAEQDNDECIQLLHNFGIDLDQVTDDDNKILARASSLHIAAYYNRAKSAKALLELGANPNVQDLHGSTPMHLAVIQGSEQLIEVLRHYSDLALQDNAGNTPIAYCRNNKKLQKLLVSPVVAPLLNLAKGGFSSCDEKAALEILEQCGVPGVLSPGSALAVRDTSGTSVLSHAVMYGRREVAEKLLSLGVSANLVDASGISALTWAHWTKNARVKKLLKNHGAQETAVFQQQKANLELESSKDTVSAALLFPSPPPPCTTEPPSSITTRMSLFVNAPCSTSFPGEPFAQDKPMLEASSRRIDKQFHTEDLNKIDPQLLWNSKLNTVRHIANGSLLDAAELMAIGMFTNNGVVAEIVNSQLLQRQFSSVAVKDYVRALHASLAKLTPYHGEVFLAAQDTDRKLFMKGTEFTWNRFVSTSTLWRVALENIPSFTSNARRGVIFLVKSSTGRLIGQFSQHSFDAEVIFLPRTRFRVTNWYHGDPIALGQQNIRNVSYGIKDEDDERLSMQEMIKSDKRLIIELTEIE